MKQKLDIILGKVKIETEYSLLLSWRIAEELAPKLREKWFKGDFIVPLPSPRILKL